MKNIHYYPQSLTSDNRDFRILSEIVELFQLGLKATNIQLRDVYFPTKP